MLSGIFQSHNRLKFISKGAVPNIIKTFRPILATCVTIFCTHLRKDINFPNESAFMTFTVGEMEGSILKPDHGRLATID